MERGNEKAVSKSSCPHRNYAALLVLVLVMLVMLLHYSTTVDKRMTMTACVCARRGQPELLGCGKGCSEFLCCCNHSNPRAPGEQAVEAVQSRHAQEQKVGCQTFYCLIITATYTTHTHMAIIYYILYDKSPSLSLHAIMLTDRNVVLICSV